MTPKDLIVLLDCGDTLIDEGTEIHQDPGVVLSGDLVPGADRMVRDLVADGFRLALVADGRHASFENLLSQHGLFDLFETLTCSEAIRHEKPSPRMFKAALGSLDLAESDASRCVMVGNNLARDIAGANRMGIRSIHLAWTDRYPKTPADPDEIPDHTISTPAELLPLLRGLEDEQRP
ncbi:hydrolase [Brachybacterium sp. P6-10-X1]|uniref:HAD family hydrolase n=1 Tax=Brachybacterium sp. P6-10-X1 TaxID=1903186 RepID=UPI0009719A35|nr:HAD family hydrolase [Brachybacterium sp. P6-10-X1]APX33542.1 hydrolase [Brachybacterium sp. P6-10-X1]